MDVEPEVIERIEFYRRSATLNEIAVLLPLVFGLAVSVMLTIIPIIQGRFWFFEFMKSRYPAWGGWLLAGFFILLALLVCGALSATLRKKKAKHLSQAFEYDRGEYEEFKRALDGVCLALGMETPPLVVLDMPVADTLSFRVAGKPTVGVTLGALKVRLSAQEKEAMMADEIAHVLLGESFFASGSSRLQKAADVLVNLIVVFTFTAALVVTNPLFFIIPLATVIPFAAQRIKRRNRVSMQQNLLLADSIAARITSNPRALRETMEKIYALSVKQNAGISGGAEGLVQGILSRLAGGSVSQGGSFAAPVRQLQSPGSSTVTQFSVSISDVDIPDILSDYREQMEGSEFTYKTFKARLENMRAIEQGRETDLEEPLWRGKLRNVTPLALSVAFVIVAALIIAVPWAEKATVWNYMTTNWVGRLYANESFEKADLLENVYIESSLESEIDAFAGVTSSQLAAGVLPDADDFTFDSMAVEMQLDAAGLWLSEAKSELETARDFHANDEYAEYAEARIRLIDLELEMLNAFDSFVKKTKAALSSGADYDQVATEFGAFSTRLQAIRSAIYDSRQTAKRLKEKL